MERLSRRHQGDAVLAVVDDRCGGEQRVMDGLVL